MVSSPFDRAFGVIPARQLISYGRPLRHEESVAPSSVTGFEFVDSSGKTWSVQRELRMDDVEVLKGSSKVVEVKVGAGNETVIRDFKFQTPTDAEQFEKGLARVKELEKELARKQIASYKESSKATLVKSSARGLGGSPVIGDNISLLFEIVSAVHLPKADVGGTSDPYCVVKLKGNEIHRTKVIKQNLQPIWTLETGSMFCIVCTPEEFFASSSGISFTIKDYDLAGADDVLATVSVPLNVALESKGERTEYTMTLEKAFAKKGAKAPSLFLRIKPASQDDIEVRRRLLDCYCDSPLFITVYAIRQRF
jgi:hypothetical protein